MYSIYVHLHVRVHVHVHVYVHMYNTNSEAIPTVANLFQGIHTKMVQVCSHCLSIPINKIHISESSIDKVPNAVSTLASSSSDINGMAVKVSMLQSIIYSIIVPQYRMPVIKLWRG